MATGGVKRFYEEDDRVDEYLLHQLSKYVLYNCIGALARNLRLSQAEFIRVTLETNQPEEQIFKVRIIGDLLIASPFLLNCFKMSVLCNFE